MFKFNYKVKSWLAWLVIVLVLIIAIPLLVWALPWPENYYRSNHNSVSYMRDVIAKKLHVLTNVSSNDYFIPNKSNLEHTALKDNLPTGLSISDVACDDVDSISEWECGDDCSYQNHSYSTVMFGSQCWLNEDLRALEYNGTPIPQWLVNDPVPPTAIYYSCSGPYSGDNCSTDEDAQILYQFFAALPNGGISGGTAIGATGICPPGWHIPSEAEQTIFFNTAASKGCNYGGYTYSNCDGFNFRVTGFRYGDDGAFYGAGSWGSHRASEPPPLHSGNTHHVLWFDSYPGSYVWGYAINLKSALPVRCIRGQGSKD